MFILGPCLIDSTNEYRSQTMDHLANRLSLINPYLDEWFLEYTPLNHTQCIALLEQAKILSRIELTSYVLNVIIGFESELFVWNDKKKQFNVTNGYATAHFNSHLLRNYCKGFADTGTKFRIMYDFTQEEHLRGQIFNAFQIVLGNILEEIIGQVNQVREKLLYNKSKLVNEFNISLLAIEPYLNDDLNGNITTVIQNLYSIYTEVVAIPVSTSPSSVISMRVYCNQTLTTIYNRLFIPHKRMQSIVYTMFDYCLRPLFISMEHLLSQFQSIDELSNSSEMPFTSMFKTDDDMYYVNYEPDQLRQFWNDFFHFDTQFGKNLPLFSDDTLKIIAEAIKSSFALRKNGFSQKSLCIGSTILTEFHSNLNANLDLYGRTGEYFNIDNDTLSNTYQLEANSISCLFNLPPLQVNRFKSYTFPKQNVYNVHSILKESLASTFDKISRPIIQNFMNQFRSRHLKLFNYYSEFFLVQQSEHILQYIYFLFPVLNGISFNEKSFEAIQALVNQIHQCNSTGFSPVLQFFRLHISKFNVVHSNMWFLELFDNFIYTPSFGNDFKVLSSVKPFNHNEHFYNFWPLTQLFNYKVTERFNQILKFLLKLRFIQHYIGIQFFISPQFRKRTMSKSKYLFRFQLLNHLVLIGLQVEHRLQELIRVYTHRFEKINSFDEYLNNHQRFIEKLAQINEGTDSLYLRNIINSATKFCYTNFQNSNHSLTPGKNRTSIYDTFLHLDRLNQDDFFSSFQV